MTEDQLEKLLVEAKRKLLKAWDEWAGNMIDDQHERGDDDREGDVNSLIKFFALELPYSLIEMH